GMVTNAREWDERKREILALAQFYEYGYKPRRGIDYTVAILENGYDGTGDAADVATVTARVTPTNARFAGGVVQDVTVTVTLPAAVPAGHRAPIAFGGNFASAGLASVRFPSWARDDRSDAGAWGSPNRAGVYYTLF